ncbi:hypothetical protein F503_06807 [Ophiostoma piceae UAMH 11346]|uniref:Uncharacterized protein n=1 Tax=Ophiostoma piceae (strain UAMH 11346) TaxID=1262450 RepID=S3CAS6_OPHP1|nr:hypothetical protein F503_06807 [Ophiostoma piceae UAMH 11346]
MMVIGLLSVAAIPSTIGVCQALSAQKKQNAAQKEKVKFMATAELSVAGEPAVDCHVLCLDHPNAPAPGHKFAGYYFTYPSDEAFLGLVSTIADDPPMLNWIYIHKDTGMMQHAGRKDTIGHLVGPWGWTDDDQWLTLGGLATGFMAAEDEKAHTWHIFLDRGEKDSESELLFDRRQRQVPILIRRRLELGMESRYVRDSER